MFGETQHPTLAETIEFLHSARYVIDQADILIAERGINGLDPVVYDKAKAGVEEAIRRLTALIAVFE